MLRKLIIGTVFLVLILMVVSVVVADEQGAKADKETPVTTGSTDVGKNGSKQTYDVPPLLCSIPGETEADKLKRMAEFTKENRPQPFTANRPESQSVFCRQFMEDFLQMRNIEAIEPDFVTGSDEKVAGDEVTDRLNMGHCADMEHEITVPCDENPLLRSRESPKFNDVSEIGGPPYRLYYIELVPGEKTKYPVLYYNAREGAEHTGFARLDLKKCELGEIRARSEISNIGKNLFQIGSNVLVRYQGEVFALLLDYGSYSTYDYGSNFKNYCRLELYGLSQTASMGYVCHWSYYR